MTERDTDTYELSKREIQCLTLAAAGYNGHESAEALGIGYQTVRHYLNSAREKIAAKNTTHAVSVTLRDDVISEVAVNRIEMHGDLEIIL